MALLQISEPGQSPDPHQRRIAVGIDLGTTHSLIAAVRNGVVECLPDTQGRVLLPSVVRYLPQGTRQIGFDALAAQLEDPVNTISSFKRFMGRGVHDVPHENLPYCFSCPPDNNCMLCLDTAGGVKSPVQLSAEVLATLRQRAEDTFHDDVYGAVITVPAYFDDAQRQATKDAAQLANIHLLRLINEPTAAAIAYGLDNASEGIYVVYDLGGGTFDISILRMMQGVFEVIVTGGDSALGGDDYDAALAAWVLQRSGLHARTAKDKTTLRTAARACKEALSSADSAPFHAALDDGAIIDLVVHVADFEAITRNITARTMDVARQAMRDAGLQVAEVQGVVLVGGSTRLPQVRRAVAGFFGMQPLTNLNPDEVVALGAAIQANQLAGNDLAGDLLLLDVIPLSLGVETMGGLVERIIERNETIPTSKAQDFTTYKDGQTALALHVVQGERELAADCRSLARFELRGIPPMAAGAARIRVTFTVDADGLLSVGACEQSSGVEAHVHVKPSYGLNDEQIANMLQDSFAAAAQDMRSRTLVEARVDAQRLLDATASALQADADLLSDQEHAAIVQGMDVLKAQIAQKDASAIEKASQNLTKTTEAFAAARMNRSIQQALAGKNVRGIA